MFEINWNRFVIKNSDATTAFENMCRHLFFRKFKISGYEFSYNYNQTGLETEPIKYENEYYGFQCKFSESGNTTAFYDELYKSLSKAFLLYANLKEIYVYTNLNIKPNISKIQKLKSEKSKSKLQLVLELADKNKIKLIWIMKDNFDEILNEKGNLDIFKFYFSDQDDLNFMKSSISMNDRTFLESNQFIDLPINGAGILELKKNIKDNSIYIITGAAGTGKSEILKWLYLSYENEYLDSIEKHTSEQRCVPVFVKLRDCINGNLEDLVRQRLKDYKIILSQTTTQYIYFFDGIDEINSASFIGICTCLDSLLIKPTTKAIIMSSRTDTSNLTVLYKKFQFIQYSIEPLKREHIERYFQLQNTDVKNSNLIDLYEHKYKLIDDIDDIFSVTLLWNYLEFIEEDTTKIDLIAFNSGRLINRMRHYSELNLPEGKEESIGGILSQVAYEMQLNNILNISREKIRKIIESCFPKVSYVDMDVIIDSIAELMFDRSETYDVQKTYSFRHKRYYEFYLYHAIKNKYYDDPFILRELHLFSNQDFMINIFMTQEIKENTKARNLNKVLMLRFLEEYLGEIYTIELDKKWKTSKRYLVGNTDSYLELQGILDFLCTKQPDDLKEFLKLNVFSMRNIITEKNFLKFVKDYYLATGKDILPVLKEIYEFDDSKISEMDMHLGIFYLVVIQKKDIIQELYSEIIDKYKYKSLEHDLNSYLSISSDMIKNAVNFFEMVLHFCADWLLTNIKNFSKDQIEILCYTFFKVENSKYLFSDELLYTDIRKAICSRIGRYDEEINKINSIVFYNLVAKSNFEQEVIISEMEKANITHYGTWDNHLELNSFAAICMKDKFKPQCSAFILGVSIRRIVYENYFINKNQILELILEEVKKFNMIYDNWFCYKNSILLGELIGGLNFKTSNIKWFIREIHKYESVISLFSLLYRLMKVNKKTFLEVANPTILLRAYEKSIYELSYYDDNSEQGLRFATMISYFDKNEYVYFENAINNAIFRPVFRKEDILDVLVRCLEDAYINEWIEENELENLIVRVYKLSIIAEKTLDSGVNSQFLEYFEEDSVDGVIPAILSKYQPQREEKEFKSDWLKEVSLDNLKDYYECSVDGIDYTSKQVWDALINFERQNNPKLQLLYAVLQENNYPEWNYSRISNYVSIITAVVLSNNETREDMITFIMKQGGRMSLANMIRTYSLIGDDSNARKDIFSFLNICAALIYPNKSSYEADKIEKDIDQRVLGLVYFSKREDWYIDSNNTMTLKKDLRITVKRDEEDEEEQFYEEWATNHPDPNAVRVTYRIMYENRIVKECDFVYVDGYRALLPLPKFDTNVIRRKDYLLCVLLTDNVENLNRYIIQSNLCVE